ncbi:hypothetical protein ACQR0Z_23705 [Bradyrhizobium sp. HKCCYLS3077]|uniref:hypothetical protein n=1 Tax=Bradyrhizobium sp. HKCCYLS3077 TaxID=3420761 RepID=UPI003EB8EC66
MVRDAPRLTTLPFIGVLGASLLTMSVNSRGGSAHWTMNTPTGVFMERLQCDTQPCGRAILLICYSVMPGFVPGIHVVLSVPDDVDGRDEPGHDDVVRDERISASQRA